MFVEPRSGRRHVEVTPCRTEPDCVHCLQQLVDGYSPEAEVIRVGLGNLTRHTPAAVYACLPPREAHRLLRRLECHYTPHGSWLNMVERELSVLAGQCLQRRLPDTATVQQEIAAWERQRKEAKTTVHLAVHHREGAQQTPAPLPPTTRMVRSTPYACTSHPSG